MPRMKQTERKKIEIDDLVELLEMDQQVKTFLRDVLQQNPTLVEKATVTYADSSEL